MTKSEMANDYTRV